MNYQQPVKIHQEPERELAETLRALDRLIHRTQTLLGQSLLPKHNLEAWRKASGLWKGKITEDPLAYQKRIRGEE